MCIFPSPLLSKSIEILGGKLMPHKSVKCGIWAELDFWHRGSPLMWVLSWGLNCSHHHPPLFTSFLYKRSGRVNTLQAS